MDLTGPSRAFYLETPTSPDFATASGLPGLPRIRQWSSFIGIVAAICGNLLISVALNIQRYAHKRLRREYLSRTASANSIRHKPKTYGTNDHQVGVPVNGNHATSSDGAGERPGSSDSDATIKPDSEATPYTRSPYWWAGLVLMLLGEVGNFMAYGFAPASIVSPLGVVALISNCVIAPVVLKEPFRQQDFWGVITAIAGVVVVVLSARQKEVKMGPGELWEAIARIPFLVYATVSCSLIILLLIISRKYGSKSILIDLGLVALFGAYTALSTKGISSLLSYRLWRVLTFPITYALVLVLIVTALCQIKYLNRALQHFDSTQVIPTQFVLFTLSVIIGSAVLYKDFEKADLDRVTKFVAGCALTFVGVYLITSGRESDDEEDEYGEFDEEAIRLVQEEPVEDETHPLKRKSTGGSSIASSNRPRAAHSSLQMTLDAPESETDSIAPQSSSASVNGSLLQNPWVSSTDSIGTTDSRPSRTLSRQHSHVQEEAGQTPSRRQSVSRRKSVSLVPGPFISPLSSSLGAAVAETLRRGVDVITPTSSVRHRSGQSRRSRLRSSLLRASRPREGDGSTSPRPADAGQSDSSSSEAEDEDNTIPSSSKKHGGSSLSDIFRGKRQKRSQDGDDEAL